MSARIISLDFETYYCKKEKYDIRQLGTWHYVNHERFDPYLISVCDGSESWAGNPSEFNWGSLEGATLVSHNKFFDFQVYRAMVAKGLAPEARFVQWLCSMNMSAYICNRRALADAVEFLLGRTVDKSTREDADGKTYKEMRADAAFWTRMLKYGRQDAFDCWELFHKFGDKWPSHERRLSEMTIAQGIRGIQVNRPLLNSYIATAHMMLKQTESLLPWVSEGSPPTSPKAIVEHCRKCGIPGPPVKSREGEDAFLAWESAYSPTYEWIANVGAWRSVNKFLESLYTIKERLMPGDIFSFSTKYFGGHTGRWSGDAGFNMQNMRKVPLYRDEMGLLITDEARLQEIIESDARPSYVTASLDVRALFIARP